MYLVAPHTHDKLFKKVQRLEVYCGGAVLNNTYTVGHKKTHQNVFGHNFRKTGRILNKFGRLLPK